MSVYLFWNAAYVNSLPAKILKGQTLINIKNRQFTPDEFRSMRKTEMILLPADDKENHLARALLDEMNKYGVVAIRKKPYQKHPTPENPND